MMMSKNVQEAFNKCFEFINNSTPEELMEYEKSLNLNEDDYKDGITLDELKIQFNKGDKIMKKYTWSFDQDIEIWSHDLFDTIEECIKDAEEYAYEFNESGFYLQFSSVFIGEATKWDYQSIDVDNILYNLEEKATEECGESGLDWKVYDYSKKNEFNELNDIITKDIKDWQKKYGYTPGFYTIENIKEYELEDNNGY